MSDLILAGDGVSKVFGGLVAVSDVRFEQRRGSIASIIGPNGAGKTTLFNMITGLYRPSTGSIVFNGRDVTRARPDVITRLGLARTFQNIRLFPTMTAVENAMIGAHGRTRAGIVGSILRTPRVRREERDVREKARATLAEVGLRPATFDRLAINLSYGDQRRVELARALASDPQLVLLDEPTAGMSLGESEQLAALLRRLRDERQLSLLLIEHDMRVVMGLSDHITVLDHGVKIAEGTPAEVRNDPQVIKAYLGEEGDA